MTLKYKSHGLETNSVTSSVENRVELL